jgi:S1-C subfamily serine protease
VRRSPRNDLAALKVDARPPSFLPLSEQPPSLGQPIFTIGFPEIELLGAEPKFTEGTVTALSGSSDEASDLQVSIPVQSGSSGGPVVTHDGSVVGIVTSVMSDEAFVEDGGVPPQLVNFATRAELAKVLTSASATAAPTHGRSAAIERAKGAVVRIVAESD